MAGDDNEHSNLVAFSPTTLVLLLSSIFAGGAGSYGVLGPQLESQAIASCFDNSQVAIDVAAQHGQEILNLRNLILERTRYRYTSEDADREWTTHRREQEAAEATQNRRLYVIERHIDSHDNDKD